VGAHAWSIEWIGVIHNINGLTRIENSTITNNTAPPNKGSGVSNSDDNETSTEVLSTIISKNANSTDVRYDDDEPRSFSFHSLGYNLIGGGNASPAFNQSSDQTGVDTNPLLGPLANNGGPTDTHALLAGSPAIDTGDSALTTDQRGFIRPQDGDNNGTVIDDRGALEVAATPPPSSPPKKHKKKKKEEAPLGRMRREEKGWG
jgi:hypothetical protein